MVLALAVSFRGALFGLIPRLKSLKHGETELTFAEGSQLLISDEVSAETKAQVAGRQIISSGGDFEAGSGYRLYANGTLVQRLRIRPTPGTTRHVYPVAFPNDVASIRVIGNIEAKIIEIGRGNCQIAWPSTGCNDEIVLLVSGV